MLGSDRNEHEVPKEQRQVHERGSGREVCEKGYATRNTRLVVNEFHVYLTICLQYIFGPLVTNVWSLEKNKNKVKLRRNSQQVYASSSAASGSVANADVNSNANIIQTTNQKFGTNGKITAKPGGLGHEGKYTPK